MNKNKVSEKEKIFNNILKKKRSQHYLEDKALFNKLKLDLEKQEILEESKISVDNLIRNYNFDARQDNFDLNRNFELKYLDTFRKKIFGNKLKLKYFYFAREILSKTSSFKFIIIFFSMFTIFFLQYIDLYYYPFFTHYTDFTFQDIIKKLPPFF
jgi:hypothetical protein